MIPKHIHYIWVGGPLPAEQCEYVHTWRETNPDYRFTLWNESNIDISVGRIREAYDQKKWSKVADIVGLKHGGIYFDTDLLLFKPLDDLIHHECFFGFQTSKPSQDWVTNAAFGAVPGHWFIARALTRLLSMRSLPGGLERPTTFGPKLITRLLVEEGLKTYLPSGTHVRDIYLCPTEVFYPYAYGEAFRPSCMTPETLTVHFWSKSCEANIPRWVRTAKVVRKHLRKLGSRVSLPLGTGV